MHDTPDLVRYLWLLHFPKFVFFFLLIKMDIVRLPVIFFLFFYIFVLYYLHGGSCRGVLRVFISVLALESACAPPCCSVDIEFRSELFESTMLVCQRW